MSCTSGVRTVKFSYELPIVSNSNSAPTYSISTNTSIVYTNYQWYNNLGPIPGATLSTYAPTCSGVYHLVATNSCGNTLTSNTLTYSAPNTQCNTILGPYNTCNSTFTLNFTPSAGYSVDWYECDQYGANGSFLNSGTSSTVSPSSTSSQNFYYYYVCTDVFTNATCTSAVIDVRFDMNLNIWSNNGTTLPATLFANPSSPIYSAHQWYRNGQRIFGAVLSIYYATLPGEYYMTCTSSCGASTSNAITFCSIGITYSNKTFTGSTTHSNTTLVLDGTIIINPGATLNINNCDVYMTAGSEIIARSAGGGVYGGNLILSNSKIMGCGKWGGIYAEGGIANNAPNNSSSARVTLSHSEIHDAYIGLFADNNAILAIDYTLFENNFIHIDLRKFGGSFSACPINHGWIGNNFDFSHNTFNYLMEIPPSFSPTNLPSPPKNNSYRKQVYIDYGNTIKLSNSIFNCYNWGTQDQNAVEVYTVYGTLCNVKGFEIDSCTFNGDFNDAMMFTNVKNLYINNTNISGDVNHGIEVFGGDHVYVSSNIIHNSSNSYGGLSGANVSQVNNFQFHRNDVQHFVKGIEYYNVGNNNSGSIDSNTFKCDKYGIVVAPECDPTDANCTTNSNNYSNTRYLDLLCNRIFYCNWGIVGVGNLKTQIKNGKEWQTSFDNINNTYSTTSTNADVAWYNSGGLQIVIYNLINTYPLQWVGGSLNLDGHSVSSGTNLVDEKLGGVPATTYRTSSLTPCITSPSMKDSFATAIAAVMQQTNTINIYPNPADEYIVLENNFESAVGFSLVDMTGKQVLTGCVKGKLFSQVDISNLPQGCYLIRIYGYTNGENLHSQRVIKTGQ